MFRVRTTIVMVRQTSGKQVLSGRGVQGLNDPYRLTHIKGFWKNHGRIPLSISGAPLHFSLHFGLVSWTHPRDRRDIALAILKDALTKRAVGRLLVHFRSF